MASTSVWTATPSFRGRAAKQRSWPREPTFRSRGSHRRARFGFFDQGESDGQRIFRAIERALVRFDFHVRALQAVRLRDEVALGLVERVTRRGEIGLENRRPLTRPL